MFSLIKSSARESRWREVERALKTTGSILLFFFWMLLVFGGLGTLSDTSRPSYVGWLALALAALIVILTMDRWIKALPGLLAYGVVNGLIMAVSGHLVNNPSVEIPRITAIGMVVLATGAAVIASTFRTRKLTRVDRTMLFGVFVSVLIGIAFDRFTLLSFGLMVCFLAIAWWTDRIRRSSVERRV